MKLLTQLQLSNYDTSGTWALECDSGFQMCFGRIREMLKINANLFIDVIGPRRGTLKTQPEDIVGDLFKPGRVKWFEVDLIANALATRYDFNFNQIGDALGLGAKDHQHYDAVYINDPMMLRHYKALFLLRGKYRPRYYVHSHFIDTMECPKFPPEASLWLGQCEAALRADYNFWQCESAMLQFFDSMGKWFTQDVVDDVRAKSTSWDDGFSAKEIGIAPDPKNVRFDTGKFQRDVAGKIVVFVPNRIGGRGRSSDYTNCGKFMFDILPELRKRRQDFVVIAGNPSQKFLNRELQQECGPNGYLSLVPDAFNRDEFKYVIAHSHVAVGLYDQDSYGGTAARECIELGLLPLWIDNFEYSSLARWAKYGGYLARPDFSDLVDKTDELLTDIRAREPSLFVLQKRLQWIVRERCSYEATTPAAMKKMGLLNG